MPLSPSPLAHYFFVSLNRLTLVSLVLLSHKLTHSHTHTHTLSLSHTEQIVDKCDVEFLHFIHLTMCDDNVKLHLAAEGVLCGERVDMYHFLAAFLGESAPGRPLSEVSVVAGDGFFDQEMIIASGFTLANFINDQ